MFGAVNNSFQPAALPNAAFANPKPAPFGTPTIAGFGPPATGFNTGFGQPTMGGFGQPAAGGFGQPAGGFGTNSGFGANNFNRPGFGTMGAMGTMGQQPQLQLSTIGRELVDSALAYSLAMNQNAATEKAPQLELKAMKPEERDLMFSSCQYKSVLATSEVQNKPMSIYQLIKKGRETNVQSRVANADNLTPEERVQQVNLVENVVYENCFGKIVVKDFINLPLGFNITQYVNIEYKQLKLSDIENSPLYQKRAEVWLYQCKPEAMGHEEEYRRKLAELCESVGNTFIDYDVNDGTWRFETELC